MSTDELPPISLSQIKDAIGHNDPNEFNGEVTEFWYSEYRAQFAARADLEAEKIERLKAACADLDRRNAEWYNEGGKLREQLAQRDERIGQQDTQLANMAQALTVVAQRAEAAEARVKELREELLRIENARST